MNKILFALLFTIGCSSGGVSQAVKQDLQKTVSNNSAPIELCYKTALEANAALSGDVTLKFEIFEGKKELTNVKVSKTTLNEPTFEQCLVQEMSELSLSKPPEAKLVVTYPLKFTKSED